MRQAEAKQLYQHGILVGFNAVKSVGEKKGWRLEFILENPSTGNMHSQYLHSQRSGVRVFKTVDALIAEVERIKAEPVTSFPLDAISDDEQMRLEYEIG